MTYLTRLFNSIGDLVQQHIEQVMDRTPEQWLEYDFIYRVILYKLEIPPDNPYGCAIVLIEDVKRKEVTRRTINAPAKEV